MPSGVHIATVAQSVEQTFRKRQVKGSNPFGGLAFFPRFPDSDWNLGKHFITS